MTKYPQPIILLVDDDEVMCKLLSEELERLKFRTDYALNGKDAIKKVIVFKYNLVIMGINMPGMRGDVALREIKGYHPNLPVIILTSQTDIKIKDRCFKLGAADYITKPFDFEDLFDAVIENINVKI